MNVAVIPAYNEEKTVAEAVRGAAGIADRVLVVDDGSTDRTGEIARAAGALVVRHSLNRGLGGALGTGIEGALRLGADAVLTMDADGQHRPEDAKRVLARVLEGDADFVIGSRMLAPEGMPFHRQIANRVGNLLTWALFGLAVSDSQSGLRAMTRSAAERIELKTDRMEVSSEFVKEIREKRLRLAEVPIKAVYTDYSMSKGQSFLTGLRTAAKLILRRLVE